MKWWEDFLIWLGVEEKPMNINPKTAAEIWGAGYQGKSDEAKMKSFIRNMQSLDEEKIPEQVKEGAEVGARLAYLSPDFEGEDLREMLIATSAHESRFKYREQIGGGPAKGLWQIEPTTGRDLVKRYQNQLDRGRWLQKNAGISARALNSLGDEEFQAQLRDNDILSGAIAALKYVDTSGRLQDRWQRLRKTQ